MDDERTTTLLNTYRLIQRFKKYESNGNKMKESWRG